MLFKKNPKKLGLELGKVVFSEPIINTLWSKAEKQKSEKELLAIIAFARLTCIKYFFPISQRHMDPWNTMSMTLDDFYFATLEHASFSKYFDVKKMGNDEEYYHVSYHLDLPFAQDDRTTTTFDTFIGCAVTTRYHRYIKLLDDGFISTGNDIRNLKNFTPLSLAVADDLAFILKADPEREVLLSITAAAMHALSILTNHGLYD
jgi:hypothetical protein